MPPPQKPPPPKRPLPPRPPPVKTPTKEAARWKHGLCECLQDIPLACTVCFCQCNAAGQIFHRTAGYGCLAISALLWTFFVTHNILSVASNSLFQSWSRRIVLNENDSETEEVLTAYSAVSGVAGFIGVLSAATGTYVLCVARRAIRRRDHINTPGVGEDCCVSFWCGCCSLVQMLRQESLSGVSYTACSTTGSRTEVV